MLYKSHTCTCTCLWSYIHVYIPSHGSEFAQGYNKVCFQFSADMTVGDEKTPLSRSCFRSSCGKAFTSSASCSAVLPPLVILRWEPISIVQFLSVFEQAPALATLGVVTFTRLRGFKRKFYHDCGVHYYMYCVHYSSSTCTYIRACALTWPTVGNRTMSFRDLDVPSPSADVPISLLTTLVPAFLSAVRRRGY